MSQQAGQQRSSAQGVTAQGVTPPQRTAAQAAVTPTRPVPGPAADPPEQPAPSGLSGLRLTGRGAVVVVFALCFLGQITSDWLGWGLLTGASFVAACVLAAARTERGDLLTVAVIPPAMFLVAVVWRRVLTSSAV